MIYSRYGIIVEKRSILFLTHNIFLQHMLSCMSCGKRRNCRKMSPLCTSAISQGWQINTPRNEKWGYLLLEMASHLRNCENKNVKCFALNFSVDEHWHRSLIPKKKRKCPDIVGCHQFSQAEFHILFCSAQASRAGVNYFVLVIESN